jgi:hypothetical protein
MIARVSSVLKERAGHPVNAKTALRAGAVNARSRAHFGPAVGA